MFIYNKNKNILSNFFSSLDLVRVNFVGKTFNYKNILSDGFIVQGFCIIDDYMLISAYSSLSGNKRKKSRIYFYDKISGEFIGLIILDNCAHVGGITYDYQDDILFVTGSLGKINSYSYKELIDQFIKNNFSLDLNSIDLSKIKIKCNDLNISLLVDGNVSAATIYYYDGCLYVATCSFRGYLICYDLIYKNNKLSCIGRVVSTFLPACVQGLIIFNYYGKKYILVSQSYGKVKSCLKLFRYVDKLEFLGQYTLRKGGIEGIDIDINGNIHCIFENKVYKSLVINISEFSCSFNRKQEQKYILCGKIHQNRLNKR